MNERIKELAQLAAESAIDDKINEVMITESEDNKLEIPDTFIKSFAELIVRECATLAFDGPNGILEHFGVEE